jgi:hypothetical protein
MRDLASVELHFTKHSSVIAEKTSRTGGLRCTVSLYKDTRVPVASFQRWLTGQLELSQAAIDEHKLKS